MQLERFAGKMVVVADGARGVGRGLVEAVARGGSAGIAAGGR